MSYCQRTDFVSDSSIQKTFFFTHITLNFLFEILGRRVGCQAPIGHFYAA